MDGLSTDQFRGVHMKDIPTVEHLLTHNHSALPLELEQHLCYCTT